jgi:hypothetical protein
VDPHRRDVEFGAQQCQGGAFALRIEVNVKFSGVSASALAGDDPESASIAEKGSATRTDFLASPAAVGGSPPVQAENAEGEGRTRPPAMKTIAHAMNAEDELLEMIPDASLPELLS